MKLIIAIMRDTDNSPVSHALTTADYRVTCVASTGGFWKRGQATLLIGVEDEKVESALEILRNSCTKPSEADPRRTILFVVNVSKFDHF
jgi:uncharacterized protein YaaQ